MQNRNREIRIQCGNKNTEIHKYGHTTEIRRRKYEYGNTNTEIRIRTYGDGNTNTEIRIRKYGDGNTDSEIRNVPRRGTR
jgi:hypothetical protein